jgi:hypothetical protein
MATEAELIEQKREERKKILDEIKRKRAAAARSEGIIGAAEEGQYGDVGQGGPKGEFDDEIDQDPGNEDPSRFSMANLKRAILGEGGGLESLMYFLPGTGDVMSAQDSVRAAKAAQEAENIVDKIKLYGLSGLAAAGALPLVSAIYDAGGPAVKRMIDQAIKQAENMGPQPALAGGVMGIDDTINMNVLKMDNKTSIPTKTDDIIPPRQIKVTSGSEPDLSKMIVIKDGKEFVNIGSATNNRLIELDKVKLVKDELIEKGRGPRDLYRFALKTSDDDLRTIAKVDTIKIAGREIPIESTTKQTDISGKTYRTINPEAQKIGIGGVPSGEPTVAEKFRKYYADNLTDKKSLADIASKDTKFRFFDNKRRTTDDVTPEEFFSNNSLKDLEKGGKFHNEYLKFKAIDDVRIKYADELKPILQKMFTKVREGTVLQKKSKANLQLAHKFEASGIKKGYVSPTKTGKGTDPSELYLDVSEYNAVIQKSLEKDARKFYNKYIESGDEVARKEYLKIDKDMKILGIEGQVAPGQTVGKAMPFDDKIRQLADEGINNKFITQKEYDKLINAAEEIAETKIKFFDTFGVKASYKYGGMVGISHLTRPLGNF